MCVKTHRTFTQASVSEQRESPPLLLSFLNPIVSPHDCLQVTGLVCCQSHLIGSYVK